MHSRIFQIEKEKVTKDEYITTDHLPDWFYTIADYTDDDCNRQSDIDWLAIIIGNIATVIGDKITFSSDVRSYFKDKYESFIKAAKELEEVSLDNFITTCGVNSTLYRLKEAYSDKYGFYVYNDSMLSTLDDFMRTVKDGETYYIGGIVDYHW